jgi:hypothetical protein
MIHSDVERNGAQTSNAAPSTTLKSTTLKSPPLKRIGRALRTEPAAHVAFIAYLAWVVVVGSRHEPWFDEAQAWLIARDNGFLALFTHGVRYEGTPALWHAVLWILERVGLPYGGLWLVSFALCATGAGVILYKSPFPLWLRVGLIFSYFLSYQYAVVARSYALDVLFIPLLALLFQERQRRPLLYGGLLGLTANTNAHSFVFAAALALEWAWTCRSRVLAFDSRALSGIALYALLGVAAALQAWPPADINFLIPKAGDNALLHALTLVTEAVIDRGDVWAMSAPGWQTRVVGEALTLLVLAPMAALWIKARTVGLAILTLGGLVGFSALKYGNFWHAGIIFLAIVFCLWISWGRRGALGAWVNNGLGWALTALVLVQGWEALAAGGRDMVSVYSPARSMARVLRASPRMTVGVAGFKAFALQPYLTQNAFANYNEGRPAPAYYLWRRGTTPIPGLSEDSWKDLARANYDELLLSTFNVMGWNGPARYIVDARSAGYCPSRLFIGAMIWKTYAVESDDMMLFDHCAAAPKLLARP